MQSYLLYFLIKYFLRDGTLVVFGLYRTGLQIPKMKLLFTTRSFEGSPTRREIAPLEFNVTPAFYKTGNCVTVGINELFVYGHSDNYQRRFICAIFNFLCNMIDMKVISSKEYEEMKKKNLITVYFGFHKSPFGRCLIALIGKRICHLSFVSRLDSVNLNFLKHQWPDCVLVNNEELTAEVAENVFQCDTKLFQILLKGTDFERKVWEALVKIPKGETVSYEDIAIAAGHGKAVRAAANAVAKNPVAYLVPCHRVIKKDGSLHRYQWGSHIKEQILQAEKHQS